MKLSTLVLAVLVLAVLVPLAKAQSTDVIIVSDAYLNYNGYDIKAVSGFAGQNTTIEIKKGQITYPLYNLTVGTSTNIPDLNFSVFIKNVTASAPGNISVQASMGPYAYPTVAVKGKAYLETTYSAASPDNTTFKILAAYSENSTGIFKLIQNSTCGISFSDDIQTKSMIFSADRGHEYVKFFNGTSLNYTVNCSHSNYTSENQTKQINVEVIVTEVIILSPKTSVATKNVSFVCEVRGQRPDKINLYTDTSGVWGIRASAEVTTRNPPYRVEFTENNVDDGNYLWNCEAEVGQTKISAPSNQPFSVKFVPPVTLTCNNENVDCGSWTPSSCPSSGKFTRSCNNTNTCNYELEKSCTVGGLVESPVSIASGEPPVETSQPSLGKNTPPKTGQGGIDTITIILVVIVAIVLVVAIIKLKKGRKENKELGELGAPEEEFEDDMIGPEGGGDVDKGDSAGNDDKTDGAV